ncbi:hypothetical protein DPMN_137465 [Dreissena polymorpha]|uniref:Uncharacterized protein n=1 Tax=Dreissena polymorpha TaxID=45954 RepID=A0A9D4G7V9_DREPO|nr:hypothetical protein DPMN_137465 [Dreissena polymorpha]
MNAYDKSLSDIKEVPLEKDKILSDRKLATTENMYADERHTAAVEITNRSTDGNV